MKRRHILIISLVTLTIGGCASAPIATTLTAVTENPAQYRNEKIELTAPVIDNPPPTGDLYRTWTFVIGHPEKGRILVTEAGYNPATINKAYHLVDEAERAGAPVTVTGKLRIGPYESLRSGAELDLDSVSYGNTTIDTDEGPYTGGYYSPYYYSPYYYRGPLLWHHRYYPYGWW